MRTELRILIVEDVPAEAEVAAYHVKSAGEERAIKALKCGAVDYVLKSNPARIGPAVRRALEEAEQRRARRAAEHHVQHLSQVL